MPDDGPSAQGLTGLRRAEKPLQKERAPGGLAVNPPREVRPGRSTVIQRSGSRGRMGGLRAAPCMAALGADLPQAGRLPG